MKIQDLFEGIRKPGPSLPKRLLAYLLKTGDLLRILKRIDSTLMQYLEQYNKAGNIDALSLFIRKRTDLQVLIQFAEEKDLQQLSFSTIENLLWKLLNREPNFVTQLLKGEGDLEKLAQY